ncbi:MAG: tetratricopeptide repeat protein [Pseudomonadota bacterium]
MKRVSGKFAECMVALCAVVFAANVANIVFATNIVSAQSTQTTSQDQNTDSDQETRLANLEQQLMGIATTMGDLQRFILSDSPQCDITTVLQNGDIVETIKNQQSRLVAELQTLERIVREVRGRSEESQFRVNQFETRFNEFLGDVDARLRTIESAIVVIQSPNFSEQNGEAIDTGAIDTGTMQNDLAVLQEIIQQQNQRIATMEQMLFAQGQSGFGQENNEVAQQATNAQGQTLPENTLGVITSEQLDGLQSDQSTAGLSAGALDNNQNTRQNENTRTAMSAEEALKAFENAKDALLQRDYAAAIVSFERFLSQATDKEMIAEALYWTGVAQYSQQDFRAAINTYYKILSDHPQNTYLGSALLGMAKSFKGLDNNETACTVLAELVQLTPEPSAIVKRQAQAESNELGCPAA